MLKLCCKAALARDLKGWAKTGQAVLLKSTLTILGDSGALHWTLLKVVQSTQPQTRSFTCS